MDRKKILILILALTVLVGGIFFIARSINNKNQVGKPNQNKSVAKKEPANIFEQDANGKKEVSATDVVGSVSVIAEKTLTVKTQKDAVVVNINGATPVVITSGDKTITGQMADLKVGDAVKVTYDETSKNVALISVIRPNAPVKTK